MSHILAPRRVTITRMSVLLVFVAPIVLALFLFAMEQVEALVLRRRPAPATPLSTTATEDTDPVNDPVNDADAEAGGEESDTVDGDR